MAFDINRMNKRDQVIAICGAVLFLCQFFSFYSVGVTGYGSIHISGHHSGFLAWGGLWFGFLTGGLAFFPCLGAPWPPNVPVTRTIARLGASALATLLLVLRFLFKPGGAYNDFVHRSWGLYIALIAVIVQVVFAVLAFKESGEALPSRADFQGLAGQFGGSQTPPPPAPGYGSQPYGVTPPPAPGSVPPPPTPSWQQPPSETPPTA